MNFIPRQYIYMLIISIILSIFVFIFSSYILIPAGKSYREKKSIMQTSQYRLMKYQKRNYKTLQIVDSLLAQHKSISLAFRNSFNIKQFIDKNRRYFESLTLTKLGQSKKDQTFDTYKVDAISKIRTPITFYTFLNNLDKQGWIIKANFPIYFKRKGESITLIFTMRIYHINSALKL